MTTWTSKTALAVAALVALTACDALPALEGLAAPQDAATPSVALSETKMANRAFTLVPPDGFCIDKATLNQRFALLARCDTLGAADMGAGAPVALITVSITPQGTTESLPTPEQTADAMKLARVDALKADTDSQTFRAEGSPPASGLDVKHWRGAMRIGGQVASLALFGPKGGRAVSSEGREILNGLIKRSQAASKADG